MEVVVLNNAVKMDRIRYLERIKLQFQVHNVCAILGPRQCGKSTIAKVFAKNFTEKVHFFTHQSNLYTRFSFSKQENLN
jgi:predicted AAA+ superfamily ATPase